MCVCGGGEKFQYREVVLAKEKSKQLNKIYIKITPFGQLFRNNRTAEAISE